jgi:hypothetical protein
MSCNGNSGGSADLEVYQGDDFLATVTVMEGSKPADITGYTAQAQIRRDVADNDPEVAVEITTVVTSPYITLSILHDVTATMSGIYVWDLQIINTDGAIETILTGQVRVTQEVTRAVAKTDGVLVKK